MAQISMKGSGVEQVDDRIDVDTPTPGDILFGDFDHSQIPLEKEEWPVIIMGSSLVGLMTGLILGYHGIRSISFDRHKTIMSHPRATGLNFRTAEILRHIGLEDVCREQSAREFDLQAGLLIVEKLLGGKFMQNVQEHHAEKDADITPSDWMWLTQAILEPILVERAPEFGYSLIYQTSIIHYEEQEDGAIVVTQDLTSKQYKKYKCQYLVAADGNRSATRRKEGIKMHGHGFLSNGLNIRFKADLQKMLGERSKHGVIYIQGSQIKGGLRQENHGKGGLLWVYYYQGLKDFPPGSVSEDEARKMLLEASGFEEDTEAELQSFAHWTLASYVADRFISKGGRVLLAGDAVHIMPPTGALGGNTGVNDAHNLAWKLAYVVTGRAAPSLLKTYEQERQPVDGFVVDQATRRFWNRVQGRSPPVLEEPYYTVELGCRYNTGAIIPDGGDLFDKLYEDPHAPTGSAGSRFPHVALESSQSEVISTLDLIRRNFVVVAVEDDSPWIKAARQLKLDIDTYTVHESSQPYRDPAGRLKAKAKLGPGDALLLRPDGFIAWRAIDVSFGHLELLRKAFWQLLGTVL